MIANRAIMQLNITVPADTDKAVFIVDYGQTITVIPLDGSPRQTFSTQNAFLNWVNGRDRNKEHYVVYVRPSRFGQYLGMRDGLFSRGFTVGLQVIGEGTNFL
jgi:hypothetical protein